MGGDEFTRIAVVLSTFVLVPVLLEPLARYIEGSRVSMVDQEEQEWSESGS
ncbi:hypothetical protein [Nonomuraea sp. NPDC049725]|uniref:hypothetical protein n=1 Tax=Nonomuraea sp. NPDC049725 TaxID=3154508 RepID=UPI003436B010